MENENTKINVTLGYTLNLGNFQSLRLDLGIVDSKREGENVDEAFERIYKFVEDKLTDKIQEAKSEYVLIKDRELADMIVLNCLKRD